MFMSLQIKRFQIHLKTTMRSEAYNKFDKTMTLTSCLINIGKLSFHVLQVLKWCVWKEDHFSIEQLTYSNNWFCSIRNILKLLPLVIAPINGKQWLVFLHFLSSMFSFDIHGGSKHKHIIPKYEVLVFANRLLVHRYYKLMSTLGLETCNARFLWKNKIKVNDLCHARKPWRYQQFNPK